MHARLFAIVTLATASAGLLTGCTAAAAEQPTPLDVAPAADVCAEAAPAGATSDAVAVAGQVGSPASVAFAAPLAIPTAERSVVVDGAGELIGGRDLVDYGMTVFDAATGARLQVEGYDHVPMLPVPAASVGAFLGCAKVGSRVVVAVPATDGEPSTVRVFDVLDTHPGIATGVDQEPVDGMPTVTLDDDGAPTVTVPGEAPPTATEIAVLKKGDGAEVRPGDAVMLQYVGVRWSNGSMFASSWSQGAPSSVVTTEAVEGYRKALEGQTIGSQVLAVIPPQEAYGEGEINKEDLTGETLVFVLDVLAAAPAATG